MENIITVQHLIGITILILAILLMLCAMLHKKVKTLSQEVFSLQRATDHRTTVLENAISQIAKELPADGNITTHDKNTNRLIESLLHKFSTRLNRKIHEKFQQEQNCWQDKFSILLSLMDKTEDDLQQARDNHFKDSWTSITELRQKSQLLFNDMQEDGIFYRMQSLWLLSNLNLQQNDNHESFRYCVAALKLYFDSRPKLPLSHKIIWKIGNSFIESYKHLEKSSQQEVLKKFQISASNVLELFQELENFESNPDILQQIRIWYNQFTQA